MKLPRMGRGFGPGTSLKAFSAKAAEERLRTSRFAAAGEDGGAVSFALV